MRTVSLTTVNREFSKLIKKVEHGESSLITRHGRPIAKVSNKIDKTTDPEWVAARDRLMDLLKKGAPLGGLRINRDASDVLGSLLIADIQLSPDNLPMPFTKSAGPLWPTRL